MRWLCFVKMGFAAQLPIAGGGGIDLYEYLLVYQRFGKFLIILEWDSDIFISNSAALIHMTKHLLSWHLP